MIFMKTVNQEIFMKHYVSYQNIICLNQRRCSHIRGVPYM